MDRDDFASAQTAEQRAAKRAERVAQYDAAIAPVEEALRRAGIDPRDVGRFVNRPVPGVIEPSHFDTARAAPLLLELLPTVAHPARETVVRRLKTTAVRPQAAGPLIAEFRGQADAYKWVVADTLQTVVDASFFDEIVELAADRKHGSARAPLFDIVRRSKSDRAITVMIEALQDPTVALSAMSALRRAIGSGAATAKISPLAQHPDETVRKAAILHLKRIAKSLGRAEP